MIPVKQSAVGIAVALACHGLLDPEMALARLLCDVAVSELQFEVRRG